MTISPRARELAARHNQAARRIRPRHSQARHSQPRRGTPADSARPSSAVTASGPPRRMLAFAVAVAAGAALLAGCSDASETTCGDFLGQSSNDQKATTKELLEDRGNSNPPAMLLAAAQGSLAGYCNVEGDDASLGDALDAFTKTLDDIGASTAPEQPED